ncbi:TPA: hypothetical protein ACH3X3_000742 [Trebouxia sp. C0006]
MRACGSARLREHGWWWSIRQSFKLAPVRPARRACKLHFATGLGDPGNSPERPGRLVDTENMAAVGRYLDDYPVNAIVIVLSAICPQVDFTLASLIQIIVGKLHLRDYNKILVAVNGYGHAVHNVAERVANNRDRLTEEQIQEHIKNEVLRSFQRWSNIGAAPNFDPVRFKDVNTFLLNSNYLVATGASDAEAFDAFRDRCMSLGEIHRDDLSQGVLPVHPELQQALAALEESQAAIARASEDRQEMLERMRAEAAAAQQAANKRHQHEITAIRLAALEESVKCMYCSTDCTKT